MAARSTRAPLRAVKPTDAPPAPPKPLTLEQAVETGDYLKILVAQRREIAQAIPEEKGPAKAALHRQLSIIAKEIEAMEDKAKQEAIENGSPVEDEAWDSEAI
ncbi:terminase small subunit [Arthrobacter phage Sarge]|uniref:Uncharacterized protein n=1 Tax=Arthrobacter phage Sarge TaxID=2885974 RepID=A0AAE8Y6J4_9CAUD|nr:terminase small subunit [Arthrobacter phage Sarge]UDL14848.1 hypothetical protein SEA_SARGE_1 [Arthrobacter phage Sarge]